MWIDIGPHVDKNGEKQPIQVNTYLFNFFHNPREASSRSRIFLISLVYVCIYLCIYVCHISWPNEKRFRPEIWYTRVSTSQGNQGSQGNVRENEKVSGKSGKCQGKWFSVREIFHCHFTRFLLRTRQVVLYHWKWFKDSQSIIHLIVRNLSDKKKNTNCTIW